jgi:hypothetical protein
MTEIPDAAAAAVLRRLIAHLRARDDVQNIDLMGVGGFCRNCLAEWLEDAGAMSRDDARYAIYGEDYAAWKARQPAASREQLAALAASQARNDAIAAGARDNG